MASYTISKETRDHQPIDHQKLLESPGDRKRSLCDQLKRMRAEELNCLGEKKRGGRKTMRKCQYCCTTMGTARQVELDRCEVERSRRNPDLCSTCDEYFVNLHENIRRIERWVVRDGTRRRLAESLVRYADEIEVREHCREHHRRCRGALGIFRRQEGAAQTRRRSADAKLVRPGRRHRSRHAW